MKINKKFVAGVIYPVLAALIWGLSFTGQSICAEYMPAFHINGIRSLIAAAVLMVVSFHIKKKRGIGERRDIIMAALTCGLSLFAAVNLQQLGLEYGTDSGKAGFITATYAVMVPIYQFIRRKPVEAKVWAAIAIAFAGLYLMCITGDFSVAPSDIYIVLAAVAFTAQIVFLDIYTKKVEPIAVSCGQFLVTGVLSMLCADLFERGRTVDIVSCLPYLLYIAIMSSCIAYTLQTMALKDGDPTIVSLLLCLESVFALIGGAIVLDERLTAREYTGCGLMMVGVVLSQIPGGVIRNKVLRRRS